MNFNQKRCSVAAGRPSSHREQFPATSINPGCNAPAATQHHRFAIASSGEFLGAGLMGGAGAICKAIRGAAFCAAFILVGLTSKDALAAPAIDGCPIFLENNAWNTRVDTLPVHTNSDAFLAMIGTNTSLHPDFGSDLTWGIPFVVVSGTQAKVAVTFDDADESDPGPYPIPLNPPIEGGPASTGDRHVLVLDKDNHKLYEMWDSRPNGDGTWNAGSGAVFDLNTNALRPDTWTSADAAGLPILPGLVKFDEVAAGRIEHAIRFTAVNTRNAHIWPARHDASSHTGAQYPPMGQRFRLRAGFDVSVYSPAARTILTALKKYGLILADNGSNWFISGTSDSRWDDNVLNELKQVTGRDFEAVDTSSLMLNYDSGAVVYPRPVIQHFLLAGSNATFSINNLFPGATNVIDRTFDLQAATWQFFSSFFCETATTNWTCTVSNSWDKVFFRIRRP